MFLSVGKWVDDTGSKHYYYLPEYSPITHKKIVPIFIHYSGFQPRAYANIEPDMVGFIHGPEVQLTEGRAGWIRGNTAKVPLTKIAALVKASVVESAKIYSGPSSDAPAAVMGTMLVAEKAVRGLLYNNENFMWRTPPLRGYEQQGINTGVGLADNGPVDNAAIAAAVRGLQRKFPTERGAAPRKIVSFFTNYKKQLSIYFEEVPAIGDHPQKWKSRPSPKPWIFDKWLRRETREIAPGYTILVFLVQTRDNPDWGVQGGFFLRTCSN